MFGSRIGLPVPVVPVRAGLQPYAGPAIGWPPGWAGLWTGTHVMPAKKVKDISEEMKAVIQRTAMNYPMYAGWFRE